MDKLVTWKLRMEKQDALRQSAHMQDEIDYELLDEAERLAIEAFGPQAEHEHIEAVYERLMLHARWGLPTAGVVTVH